MANRTRSVAWTPLARAGLDEILAYIAEDSPEAAERCSRLCWVLLSPFQSSLNAVALFLSYATGLSEKYLYIATG